VLLIGIINALAEMLLCRSMLLLSRHYYRRVAVAALVIAIATSSEQLGAGTRLLLAAVASVIPISY